MPFSKKSYAPLKLLNSFPLFWNGNCLSNLTYVLLRRNSYIGMRQVQEKGGLWVAGFI